jgi:galactokinase
LSARSEAAALTAFAPGRVNLIGEHTDYNDGLALPFAIAAGVRVRAEALDEPQIEVEALDLGERDAFSLTDHEQGASGWRAFARGAVDELRRAGRPLRGTRLSITGDVSRGGGLSSSAALEVALCLALLAVAGQAPGDRIELARICSRIEHDWVGTESGLLDQLASLCGQDGHALRIDFRTLELRQVPLALGGHRLVALPSGESHSLASSGYNERRAECREAHRRLGLGSIRDATRDDLARLPDPLNRRVRHLITENERVDESITALQAGDMPALGTLIDASHASLRDDYEISTPAVEATVKRLHDAGALGARIIGGGFGGSVLALLPAAAPAPVGALELTPAAGARLL